MFAVVAVLLIFAAFCAPALVMAEETVAPAPAAAAAAAAPAPKIDTGDTAWMIVATALVMLMSIPGLALFYGGLAKRKDALNTMAMTFVTFCIVSVLWVIYGYTFSFDTDIKGIIGRASKLFLKGVGPNSISDLAKTIPEYIFIAYQLTFAAITVALASRRIHRAHEVLIVDHLFRALDDGRLPSGGPLGMGQRVPCKTGGA